MDKSTQQNAAMVEEAAAAAESMKEQAKSLTGLVSFFHTGEPEAAPSPAAKREGRGAAQPQRGAAPQRDRRQSLRETARVAPAPQGASNGSNGKSAKRAAPVQTDDEHDWKEF